MINKFVIIITSFIFISACGGGGGGGSNAPATDTTAISRAAALSLSFEQTKLFTFSWTDIPDATEYRLLENPDSNSGFNQVGSAIPQGTQTTSITAPLYKRFNAQYILQTCTGNACTNSTTISVSDSLVASIGYFKSSNSETHDSFGASVSLSKDGNTLAIAASEDSNATGINGNQADNSTINAGAVYIFSRADADTTWAQQAYIKASNTEATGVFGSTDNFGRSVSLSDDGNTLAVGANGEASNATDIGGDQTDNSADAAGAVYIFSRTGITWTQQAYVKASNTESFDNFGISISLSSNGGTLAVGAPVEDSNATGINGDQTDNSATDAGAVYIFSRTGTAWTQQAYLKASNTETEDLFGGEVSLSGDGNILAVSATSEDSIATGINGDQTDNSAINSGAVYIFSRAVTAWVQQAYIKASNSGARDGFSDISLSTDGNTLAVGAAGEDSSATGINGDQSNNDIFTAGAVYIFSRSDTTWSQQAYIKASNNMASGQHFGNEVGLSGDGNTLAVGAFREDSNATGINGDQANSSGNDPGAVYAFSRTGDIWVQQAYIKASNTEDNDFFGSGVSLNGDGNTLAVVAAGEDSNANGINGDQADNSADSAGAVYLY
jgi:hypothetical protein|tara:strand:+ start:21188 stop:23023 length:1836 start_codon:yes stop_codon:yes gene_type:complete